MSGTVPMITPNSITGMSANEQRPVYFLHMNNSAQPTLTVKGEPRKDDGEISIKWSSKLMKNVNDPQVNTKIMTPSEVTIFIAAARQYLTGDIKKLMALQKFLEAVQLNLTWVKMPYLAGLSDANFWREDSKGFLLNVPAMSADVKKVLLKYSQATVWTQLGKVIAVDLFNGNSDRFNSNGDWVNKGNVMFQDQIGGGIKVVGLDTFDPNSNSSNLTVMTAHSHAELDILKNAPAMQAFAQKVIASVEREICAGLRNSQQNYFYVRSNEQNIKIERDSEGFLSGYENDLVSGMMQGVNELKRYLQAKKQSYQQRNIAQPQLPGPPNFQAPQPALRPGGPPNYPPPPPPAQQKVIPQGILDRMTYLGW